MGGRFNHLGPRAKVFLEFILANQNRVGLALFGAGFLAAAVAWAAGLVPKTGTLLIVSGILILATWIAMWSIRNEIVGVPELIAKLEQEQTSTAQIIRLALLPLLLVALLSIVGTFSLGLLLIPKIF